MRSRMHLRERTWLFWIIPALWLLVLIFGHEPPAPQDDKAQTWEALQ